MSLPQPRSLMRGFLAVVVVSAFMTGLFWTFNFKVEKDSEALVYFMLGTLQGMTSAVIGYYFGTSQQAADQVAHPPLPPHHTPKPDYFDPQAERARGIVQRASRHNVDDPE